MRKLSTLFAIVFLGLLFIPSGEAIFETQTHIRDYSVTETFSDSGALDSFVNFTPFDLEGVVDEDLSRTYLKVFQRVRCNPTGISACTATITYRADPLNSPTTTQFNLNFAPRGAGQNQEVQTQEAFQGLSGYLTGDGWINTTASLSNGDNPYYSWQLWQREVYTTQVFTGGSNVEPQDHNVTVISGDTNVPEMRVYAWIMGFAIALFVLAEWRKDFIYGILSLLTFIFAAIQFPSFLPEALRLIPIAVGLYLSANMYLKYRMDSSSKTGADS